MTVERKELGNRAEEQALIFLKKQGLKLVDRNYLCRNGEIDLIMRDRKTLVFVEVRYRRSSSHGGALESVDWKKQIRLQKTALHYLQSQQLNPESTETRFDVVAYNEDPTSAKPLWVKNALS